jgi:hypothetical protein
MIRLITRVSLQTGRTRYDAATLFLICAAGNDSLPHYCPSFAQVHFGAQRSVPRLGRKYLILLKNWCAFTSTPDSKSGKEQFRHQM